MKKIGIIGLGNMGIGIARNLIKNDFEVTGFDLSNERLKMHSDLGGTAAPSIPELGKTVDAVLIVIIIEFLDIYQNHLKILLLFSENINQLKNHLIFHAGYHNRIYQLLFKL